MNILSGQSTGSTKLSLEGYLFIDAVNQIHDVGKYQSLGAGSGTYAAVNDCPPSPNTAPYTFNASGDYLMLRVAALGLKNATSPAVALPTVVTVTGTAVGGGAQTGTATFPALAPQNMALQVLTAGAPALWASVTNVTATNGIYGDGFELCTFPDYTKKVEIGFQKGIDVDPGEEVMPVPYHYDAVNHVKRKRTQGKLTIDNLYQNNAAGLSAYNNRMCHLALEIRDDGQSEGTEFWLIDKVAGTAKKKLGSGDAEISENYNGFFGRLFIFS